MTDKDYTLLRPFDLEAAKAGAPLCSYTGNLPRDYVAGPDASGRIVVSIEGNFNVHRPGDIRMAPLAWVEGKPVYKGDVLYYKGDGERAEAQKSNCEDTVIVRSERFGLCRESIGDLTWTPPKVKREGWINLYPPSALERLSAYSSSVFKTESIANDMASEGRIACIRVEWEE